MPLAHTPYTTTPPSCAVTPLPPHRWIDLRFTCLVLPLCRFTDSPQHAPATTTPPTALPHRRTYRARGWLRFTTRTFATFLVPPSPHLPTSRARFYQLPAVCYRRAHLATRHHTTTRRTRTAHPSTPGCHTPAVGSLATAHCAFCSAVTRLIDDCWFVRAGLFPHNATAAPGQYTAPAYHCYVSILPTLHRTHLPRAALRITALLRS